MENNMSTYEKKLLNKKKWYEKNKERVKEYNKKYAQKIKNDHINNTNNTPNNENKTHPTQPPQPTQSKTKIIRKTNSGGIIGICDKRNSPHYCHTLGKRNN